MYSLRNRAVAACAVVWLSAANAVAGEHPDELTLAGAVELALQRHPELVASRYEITAAQARALQAGLRINPELGVELENFAGTGATSAAKSLEATLSLSQVIELGDKRNLRLAAAEAEADLASIAQRARQLDVLAEVTRRFIDVVAAQARVQVAQQAAQLSRETRDAIRRYVATARSPLAEQSRAQLGLTRAMLAEQQAASELRAARYALAATWNDTEPTFARAAAALFSLAVTPSFQAYFERLERTPDLLRFASEARLRDAQIRLAQAQARPNFVVSLGVRRLEDTDETAWVAGFSVPLALHDRNQGAIREARARRAQSDAERLAAMTRTRATLFALHQEMTTARARLETLQGEALQQAQAALDQTRTGYERGRFSFLELASSQQDLLEVRSAAIDAAADYHRLRAELERLTSEPLTHTDPEAPLP